MARITLLHFKHVKAPHVHDALACILRLGFAAVFWAGVGLSGAGFMGAGFMDVIYSSAAMAQEHAPPPTSLLPQPTGPAGSPPVVVLPTTPEPAPAPPAEAKPSANVKPYGLEAESPPLDYEAVDFVSRPVAKLAGKSNWDDAYSTLRAAFAKLNAALGKEGLAVSGHPMAAFVETGDEGFTFEAMVPLASLPAGKDHLGEIKFAQSPGGHTLKFHHRGAYDTIDETYDALTALLDERGIDPQNLFIEEYLNDVGSSGDDTLQVEIYVFLK